jgi:predicted glutamine amidotransferase
MKNVVSIGLIWMLLFLVVNAGAQENRFIPGRINLASENTNSMDDSTHNCRFWGMLASGSFNDSIKTSHLKAFKQLASSNPNGWGSGFYTKTIRGGFIPVINRGMWRADQDFLFDSSARMMLDNLTTCGIAHIRKSSSGYVNIPDPHPFYTKSLQRDFSMLFAHNGTLNKPTLISMLGTYTNENHYSYSGDDINDPNHDTDLYRLYLMKWIDEHPANGITTCLSNALVSLTTQMGTNLSYNFIMVSNYDTLWALCYNNTLSYHRETEPSGYVWEIASQPLSETGWVRATNYYLYAFTTNKATPDSIPVKDMGFGLPENIDKTCPLSFTFPNPSTGNTINIRIEAKESQRVSLQLYDSRGRILSNLSDIRIQSGENLFIFDIGLQKSGIYCLKLDAGKNSQTKKLVIVNGF